MKTLHLVTVIWALALSDGSLCVYAKLTSSISFLIRRLSITLWSPLLNAGQSANIKAACHAPAAVEAHVSTNLTYANFVCFPVVCIMQFIASLKLYTISNFCPNRFYSQLNLVKKSLKCLCRMT